MRHLILLVLFFAAMADASPANVIRHPGVGVEGEYMVVLQDQAATEGVPGVARSLAATYNVSIHTIWQYSLRGFLCHGPEQNINAMAGDPRVKFIEQNFVTGAPQPRMSAMQYTSFNNEYQWHLDRVDELSIANLDGQHNMCTEGRTVYAYVIDSGVQSDHPQFETPTRVVESLDFSPERSSPSTTVFSNDLTNGCTTGANTTNPSFWHGTAVASVLAGTQVGVAKTQIISLKVARCDSKIVLTADLIDAVEWIADPNLNTHLGEPGVVNHSGYVPKWRDDTDPSGSDFSAYSQAVANLVTETDMPFFTSADNFSADACEFAPNDRAHTNFMSGTVFVVGGSSASDSSSDTNDYRWQNATSSVPDIGLDSGSNAGECVSIYAPANDIYAARHSAYETVYGVLYDWADGTSFSSPLVAGIAARYIEKQIAQTSTKPSAVAVYNWLLGNASATVYNVQTPEYWYCHEGTDPTETYRSDPGNCSSTRIGQTGLGTAAFHFPSVSNDSGAEMVYWDEGYCPP